MLFSPAIFAHMSRPTRTRRQNLSHTGPKAMAALLPACCNQKELRNIPEPLFQVTLVWSSEPRLQPSREIRSLPLAGPELQNSHGPQRRWARQKRLPSTVSSLCATPLPTSSERPRLVVARAVAPPKALVPVRGARNDSIHCLV